MDFFGRYDFNGVLNARANVFELQLGIVILNDLVKGNAFPYQFKDILYGNPRARHAGLPEMDVGINDYS